MNKYYSGSPTHLVAVDCIVFGYDEEELKILLFKRQVEPSKGNWSLMGGFLQDEESLDEAAKRILKLLTGLEDIYMEQFYAFGEVSRDPGERVISVTYYALIRKEDYDKNLVKEYGASWFEISNVPELIFDHGEMVQMALLKLRQKARYRPIGFELLPEKFTLPQLQGLYEAIYQNKLDKRNFRKKILSMNLLKKLEEKDKMSSKKGAFLYRFDKRKYNRLVEKGFNFELKQASSYDGYTGTES